MIKRLFFLLVCCLVSFKFSSQTITVPAGVVYNYGSDEINKNAQSILSKELEKPDYSLFDDNLLFIGPRLWSEIKSNEKIKNIKGGNTTFELPIKDDKGSLVKIDKLQGKLIQSTKDYKLLWDFIRNELIKTPFTFRKLNPQELEYYWSVISFDIDEPIYIIECNAARYIVDLEFKKGNYLLQWVDLAE